MSSFFSPYRHQFIRVGACVPAVAPAEPERNAAAVEAMLADGDRARVALMVFPELCLSAYAIDDLLFQDAVLDAVERQVARLIDASRERFPVFVVGAPLRAQGQLYNCAVAIHRGRVLGVVPKVFLPNYREFYERRHFASGAGIAGRSIALAGHSAPFGADLLFAAAGPAGFTFHVEICEDLWVPQPPSTAAALAGAEILLNLSASNITIGKAQMRRLLCASQAARCLAAYAYSAAGAGESTTDLAWDGQAGIFELGEGLAETERFSVTPEMAVADIDLGRIRQERMRTNTFGDCVRAGAGVGNGGGGTAFRTIGFDFAAPGEKLALRRNVERFPYVPADPAMLSENCYEAYNIQVQGLAQRLQATGLEKLVIGVSGGLNSTQALIVAARVMDRLGRPRTDILAYTLPGLATGEATKANAWRLMKALGVSGAEIDIRPAARQMLAGYRPPLGQRCGALRCDLRKRPGRLAHRLSVPAGQPQWRAGGRHRRSVGAGARLVHLWGRRPDVALQPQRLGRQDPDPAPDPLCRGVGRFGRGHGADPLRHPGDRDFARAGAARRRRADPVDREHRRPLCIAGLQPLLRDPTTGSARPRSPTCRGTPGATSSAGHGRPIPRRRRGAPTISLRSSAGCASFYCAFSN